jgi:hypothetical protein
MSEVKLCKDCKHCEPELYHKWLFFGPLKEDFERARCSMMEYFSPLSRVTGKKQRNPKCWIARARDDACGPEGKLFEAKT